MPDKIHTPQISNAPLIALAGITWASVGITLILLATSWLIRLPKIHSSLYAGAGIALGLLAHRLGFFRIVESNLSRIRLMDRRHSLFSFIPWKSYWLIILMITLGALLRHSAIPKQYLSIGYLCMGVALILSGIRYIREFFSEKQRKHS